MQRLVARARAIGVPMESSMPSRDLRWRDRAVTASEAVRHLKSGD